MSIKNNKKEFIEDPRYKQCNKEALIGLGLGILNLIWWFGWGYGLGSIPVSEYSYMFGLPSWFFMSCILGSIVFSVLTIIMVNKFFKDMSLEALSNEEIEEYRREYE